MSSASITLLKFAATGICACLFAGLAQARALYGTQTRVSGQTVTQLGFVVSDSSGLFLVVNKPAGLADETAPRIRTLGANPAPPPFSVGDLLNPGSQTNEPSVQYFKVRPDNPNLQTYPSRMPRTKPPSW